MRKLISIRIDPKIFQKARVLGLNIPKTCENSLKQEIQRLANANSETNCISTCDSTSPQPRLVGPPGFEPGSRAPEAQSLDHASRRPLSNIFLATGLHKDSLRILVLEAFRFSLFGCKGFFRKIVCFQHSAFIRSRIEIEC